jgi:hypothetical protein
MPLTRRAMLSLALLGALWPRGSPGVAERFVNRTGLRPGRFIWEPTKSAAGPVIMIVSLGERIAHVYRGGATIGISTCFPGRRGLRTPTGFFTVLDKARRPFASRSQGARAPATEHFVWSGKALHAQHVRSYPAWLGCVQLPLEFSALLYDVTPHGMAVIIADEHTRAGEVIDPGTLLPVLAQEEEPRPREQAGAQSLALSRFAPAKSPAVSILVSGAEAKAFVMRDGVVENEAPVTINEPHKELGTHVYSLLDPKGIENTRRWLAFGVAHEKRAAHLTTWQAPAALSRIAFAEPDAALAAARALHVGTTLIITDTAAPPSTRWTPDRFVVVASRMPQPRRRGVIDRPTRGPARRNDRDEQDEPANLHPESPR